MSGLILFIVAVALLGVAIYSPCRTSKSGAPVSYLSIKEEIIPSVPHRFLLISLPSCTVPYRSQNEGRPAGLPSFSLCLRTYDSQACSALAASNCGGGLRKRRVR